MKIYSVICRFMLAALFVLICNNVKAQTNNDKLIGVPYKEALALNEQVNKLLNLFATDNPEQRSGGTYLYSFYNATDSSRVDFHIRYAVNTGTGLVEEVLLYGKKDFLSQIYKTLFNSKFVPKDPNFVRSYIVRGKEYISISTGLKDGNIRIEPKG